MRLGDPNIMLKSNDFIVTKDVSSLSDGQDILISKQ